MANFGETSNFDTNVYQVSTADAVLGGGAGPINVCLQSLVNRSRWLYDQIASILTDLAPKASPTFTGTVTIPTPNAGDSSTKAASTAFVANLAGGAVSVPVAVAPVTLTAAQYGCGTIILTGTPSPLADINVIFPNTGRWAVINRTSGAFNTTLKTAGGSGIALAQGKSTEIIADGTNVVCAVTDQQATGAAAQKITGSITAAPADSGQTFWTSLGADSTVTLDPTAVPNGWYATYVLPIAETHTLQFSVIGGATLDARTSRTGGGGTVVTIRFDGTNFFTRNGRYVYNVQVTGWSNGSVATSLHGLGILNKRIVSLSATCVTTEGGFAVSDKITVSGATVSVNSTQATIVIPSSGLTAINQSTYASFTLTPAKWNLNLTVETW